LIIYSRSEIEFRDGGGIRGLKFPLCRSIH
jgi:hypothetical protein